MKKIKLFFYFYFSILLILFLIGVFFDLQISQFFASLESQQYYSLNIFAVVVEIFGEFPFYFLISICFVVFCCYAKGINNNILKVAVQYFLFLCATGILLLAFIRISKFAKSYVEINFDLLTFVSLCIISIFICLLIFFLLNKIKVQILKQIFKFAMIIVVVSIISVFVVQLIKTSLCFRPRFRTINFLNDTKLFKPCWDCFKSVTIKNNYLPSDACQSLPSGHTMASAIFLCFIFLPAILNLPSTTKRLCFLLPILFLILVGVGRIVAGAHFLTDVAFSAVLVGSLYVTFFCLLFRKKIIV